MSCNVHNTSLCPCTVNMCNRFLVSFLQGHIIGSVHLTCQVALCTSWNSLALFNKMNQATVLQVARFIRVQFLLLSHSLPQKDCLFNNRMGHQIVAYLLQRMLSKCLISNPVSAQYDQKMRRHLEDCLNDETLRSFPNVLYRAIHYPVLLTQCTSSSTAFAECRKSMMKGYVVTVAANATMSPA